MSGANATSVVLQHVPVALEKLLGVVAFCEIVSEPVPATCDVYCLGGGEDGPEARSALELLKGRPLSRAVEDGAVVLAVCAGFQVVGQEFAGADGRPLPGLGLLDVRTRKGSGPRAVGEVVADPVGLAEWDRSIPTLTGYENHGAVTELGPGVRPLARVRVGVGNGGGDSATVQFRQHRDDCDENNYQANRARASAQRSGLPRPRCPPKGAPGRR